MKPQNTIGRFNPAFCGKVVRIVAAVCVLEFLATIALLMMWVPAASPCRAFHSSKGAPEPIYVLIIPVGLLTLWTCILAIFWKRFADGMNVNVHRLGGSQLFTVSSNLFR